VHVGELGGEVAERAAADAVAGALRLEHAIEKAPDLRERVPVRVGEARLERPLEERADDLIQDGVAEVFLALEVVVEVALADAALAQHVVERRVVVAVHADQPARRLEDRLARRAAVPNLDAFRSLCRHVY